MRQVHAALRAGTMGLTGPTVLVNAWSVPNSAFERPAGSYTRNWWHFFSSLIRGIVADGHDVVFAAANCGQFCPNLRCGRHDRGPGRSILGANALEDVVTVGGVRTDGMWLGYSSQGPGPEGMASNPGGISLKPDFCAPSHFQDNLDAAAVNTGTSAASAIAAGAVAALRTRFNNATLAPRGLAPRELLRVLQETACKDGQTGQGWDERLGHGILDVGRAYRWLEQNTVHAT